MKHRILAVAFDAGVLRSDPLLNRSVFTVQHAPDAAGAQGLCGLNTFDLLVIGYPLPDMELAAFVAAVRKPGSPCVAAAVLVLADEGRVGEARQGVEPGRDLALSITQPREFVAEMAARLLDVIPRLAPRHFIRLEVSLAPGQAPVVCRTENISATGMLVRTPHTFAMGAMLAFELHLPGDRPPLRGEAEVIRHAPRDLDGLTGMGLRLEMLEQDGHTRLSEFLQSA